MGTDVVHTAQTSV